METWRGKRIGVLLGGDPAEREISLGSGGAILDALVHRGHDAVPIHVDHDLDLALRQERIGVAFIALKGRGGDGVVQGLLEQLGIPYTGSPVGGASLAGDKLKTKELLRLHNLPTPAYYRYARGTGGAVEQHHGFGFPCVVKPRAGGSGIGLALVRNPEELEAAVEVAQRLDEDVLVERHVTGCEVQVALLDGQVLGAAEVVADGGILDHGTGLTPGRSQIFTPPRLGNERLRGVVNQAVRAHHLLGCAGATRVDLVVSERGNESILEVEALPDLRPGSVFSSIARAGGIDFPDLVERILHGARLHTGRRLRERRFVPWAEPERRVGGAVEPH